MANIEEYKGYTINIHNDAFQDDPRVSWDHLGKMVCWHSRYTLGDVQINDGIYGFYNHIEREFSLYCSSWEDGDEETYTRYMDKWIEKNMFILPLYLYDHSGVTMSTGPFSDIFDSGQIGFIYVHKQAIRKEWGKKRISLKLKEQIYKILESEVEEYDHFLTGNVYGYSIEKDEKEAAGGCWGFYGYNHEKSGLMSNAKDDIEYNIEQAEKEKRNTLRKRLKSLKKLIQNNVPLNERELILNNNYQCSIK